MNEHDLVDALREIVGHETGHPGEGWYTVADLAETFAVATSTMYKHVAKMERAGKVEKTLRRRESDGAPIHYYRLLQEDEDS